MDKNNSPEDWDCVCGLKGKWFWLNSDCENQVKSRWFHHSCICETIRELTIRYNKSAEEMERVKKDFEKYKYENRITESDVNDLSRSSIKSYLKSKVLNFEGIIKDLEFYTENIASLLKSIIELKKSSNSNQMYFDIRYDLAKKFNVWKELFECNNEKETSELLGELYPSVAQEVFA